MGLGEGEGRRSGEELGDRQAWGLGISWVGRIKKTERVRAGALEARVPEFYLSSGEGAGAESQVGLEAWAPGFYRPLERSGFW